MCSIPDISSQNHKMVFFMTGNSLEELLSRLLSKLYLLFITIFITQTGRKPLINIFNHNVVFYQIKSFLKIFVEIKIGNLQ